MSNEATPPPAAVRKPYTGSCHCGATRYITYLPLPHNPAPLGERKRGALRIYKCNCTPCQKAGMLHVRPPSPPDDFLLLAPADISELGDYRCNDKQISWLFCKTCGGRCFLLAGEGEVVDVEVAGLGLSDVQLAKLGLDASSAGSDAAPTTVRAWRPNKATWGHRSPGYLSVQAYSLDADGGPDLAEWTEKKWVAYLDYLDETGEDSYDRPHRGGAY